MSERFYGACGVQGCDDCWPIVNERGEAVTDDRGYALKGYRWLRGEISKA